MQKTIETLFDIFYLVSVITIGIMMIRESKGKKEYLLFGIMAVVLGFGDAFHLIPRVVELHSTGLEDYTIALGIGKWITSITMTIFYILLYYVWRRRYKIHGENGWTVVMYGLSALRIILCMMPQNKWLDKDSPFLWGIYRNIPFCIMGILIVFLFYRSAKNKEDHAFRFMWITIVLSFCFYLPVVLWANQIPAFGLFMIPKTCAYIWTVFYWLQRDAVRKKGGSIVK